MKTLLTTCLALAAIGSLGASQQVKGAPVSIPNQPGHATLDLTTGELTRGTTDEKSASLVLTWSNTDYSGWTSFDTIVGTEWLDWGDLTTTSGSEIVGQYEFAYGTTALDTSIGGVGASLCTSFYTGIIGYCLDSGLGLIPEAQFCFSGLPGSTTSAVAFGWIITVSLTGGGEFLFPTGDFGFSLNLNSTTTGPLLCYAGTTPSGWQDQNGSEDVFDWYVPDVATGTCGSYWWGGIPNNFSSWWLQLWQADGTGTVADCAFYCGSNVNSNGFTVNSDMVLGGIFDATVAHSGSGALLYAYASPTTFPFRGQEILINFLDPAGELLGGPLAIGNPANFSLGVPINLALCGLSIYTQAVAFGGSGIDLHCAYDCLIGF